MALAVGGEAEGFTPAIELRSLRAYAMKQATFSVHFGSESLPDAPELYCVALKWKSLVKCL